jgi:flavin reductase
MIPALTGSDAAACLPTSVNLTRAYNSDQETLAQKFRLAMRRQVAPVAILASRADCGRAAMLATSLISVSMSPPSLLISVNRSASLHPVITASEWFSVNFLGQEHAPIVPAFSGAVKGEARFSYGNWIDILNTPVLLDSCATMICRVDSRMVYGSHEIFIGRVQSLSMTERGIPMIWRDGAMEKGRKND